MHTNNRIKWIRPSLRSALLACAAICCAIATSAGGDTRATFAVDTSAATANPTPSGAGVNMSLATLSSGAAVYPNGTIMIVGQSLAGDSANADYRMCVGAIEGLIPPRPGDFDLNRRIDHYDWSQFALCMQGPDAAISSGCLPGDVGQDDDVDLADAAAIQRLFDFGN